MIPKGLFTQIAMLVLAVGILITYVQPTFAGIGEVQDQIKVYQEERKKVISVNSRLSSLVSQLENVSRDDNRRLMTYMPDSVDAIGVSRDLALITLSSGALYQNVTYSGTLKQNTSRGGQSADAAELPVAHSFNLSVEGAYPQIKSLFRLLEQNDYPLEVHTLDIKQNDGGFLSVSMSIVTYEFSNEVEANEIVF